MPEGNSRASRAENILRREMGSVQPPEPHSQDLVAVPLHMLGGGPREAHVYDVQYDDAPPRQAQPSSSDIEGLKELVRTLQGGQTQSRRPAGLPAGKNQAQLGGPATGPEAEGSASFLNKLRQKAGEHKILTGAGAVAMLLAGVVVVLPRVTEATVGDIASQVAGGAQNAVGLGNTYGLILREQSCTEPAAIVDIYSQADLTFYANEALDPADVAQNKKDSKHQVVTKKVPLTPNFFSKTEFDDRPAKDIPKNEIVERNPKIRYVDTVGVLVCGGEYEIAGNTVTVDLSKIGIQFSSTAVLQSLGAKVAANPNMMNHYEGLYLQQNAKGKQYYTDKEIKAFNAVVAKGDNPAITDAFRANITLPGVNQACGLEIREAGMKQITAALKKDAAEQKVPSLNVVFKDGADFQNFTDTFKQKKGIEGDITPPSAVEFSRPITTCEIKDKEK